MTPLGRARGLGSRSRAAGRHLTLADEVAALLARDPSPRIAVLTDPGQAPLLAHPDPPVRFTTVDTASSAQVRLTLVGRGPWDLVVDQAAGDAVARFCELFRLLVPGGAWLVLEPTTGAADQLTALARALAAHPRRARDPQHQLAAADRRALARSVGDVRSQHGQLRIERRGATLAKVRDREMNRLLALDPSRGRVVVELPGGEVRSRSTVERSGPVLKDRVKTTYVAPPVSLREYSDVVCGTRSVVTQRGLVLPDTFRSRRLAHKGLTDAGPRFAVPPWDETSAPRLPGTYFHLDNEWRGGFGHALTEQVSRLWAYERAKADHPDLRVLMTVNRGRGIAGWERTLYAAAGVDPAEIDEVEGPVRVERLLSATPMFSMPAYLHPRLVETWDAMGSALRATARSVEHPARIFCSRRHERRACTNRPEVEALFIEHGFDVVFPEDLPLGDQVEMFHQAEIVAGFAGSGLFTVLFSDRPKHVVLVGSEQYVASNEYMIGAVRGHRIHHALCTPSRPHRGRKLSRRLIQSPFTCDMQAEGDWLRGVLQGL